MSRVHGIVLAAGGSTRFGSAKQLFSHRGVPLVRRAAETAMGAGVSVVTVVVGSNAAEVSAAVSGIPGVQVVLNELWSDGLSTSLAAGVAVAEADPSCTAVLVTLADQPLVDAISLRDLIAASERDDSMAAAAYAGTTGVPAVFPRRFFARLQEIEGDSGAGQILRDPGNHVTQVSLQGAAVDIDMVTDMEALG